MQIDLFAPISQYNVLTQFTYDLQKAMQRAHIDARLFDMRTETEASLMQAYHSTIPDFTCGFNMVSSMPIPHITICVDWATIHFPALLQCTNALIACTDKDVCDFLPQFGFNNTLWLPHAVSIEAMQDEHKLHEKRDLDIVCPMSFIDPNTITEYWRAHFSPYLIDVLDGVVAACLSSATLSHPSALYQALQNDSRAEEEIVATGIAAFDVINSIDRKLRALDKICLLEATHRPVHIFGHTDEHEKWKKTLPQKKNFIFHDAIPFDVLPDILRRSKVVLSSVPMFKRSFHERALMALGCGCSVITNKTDTLMAEFGCTKGISYFLAPDYNAINTSIEAALSSEQDRLTAAYNARQIVLHKHTWDARVATLKEKLKKDNMFLFYLEAA